LVDVERLINCGSAFISLIYLGSRTSSE